MVNFVKLSVNREYLYVRAKVAAAHDIFLPAVLKNTTCKFGGKLKLWTNKFSRLMQQYQFDPQPVPAPIPYIHCKCAHCTLNHLAGMTMRYLCYLSWPTCIMPTITDNCHSLVIPNGGLLSRSYEKFLSYSCYFYLYFHPKSWALSLGDSVSTLSLLVPNCYFELI